MGKTVHRGYTVSGVSYSDAWRGEITLEWRRTDHLALNNLYAGVIYLGYAAAYPGRIKWRAQFDADRSEDSADTWFQDFFTEEEAKAALLRVVVERLTRKETE